jgi:hypothetical protein
LDPFKIVQKSSRKKLKLRTFAHSNKSKKFRFSITFSITFITLWRIESGSYVERNPRPIEDDYINVFPDLLCQSCV